MWTVYVLKSLEKRWYYIGSTNRLERRVNEHQQKRVRSTKAHVPLLLVYSQAFGSEKEARARERFLKHNRIEKELLIRQIERGL